MSPSETGSVTMKIVPVLLPQEEVLDEIAEIIWLGSHLTTDACHELAEKIVDKLKVVSVASV